MWFVLFYLLIFWLFVGANSVRLCLGFAQAGFDKVENLVLGYAQDG